MSEQRKLIELDAVLKAIESKRFDIGAIDRMVLYRLINALPFVDTNQEIAQLTEENKKLFGEVSRLNMELQQALTKF